MYVCSGRRVQLNTDSKCRACAKLHDFETVRMVKPELEQARVGQPVQARGFPHQTQTYISQLRLAQDEFPREDEKSAFNKVDWMMLIVGLALHVLLIGGSILICKASYKAAYNYTTVALQKSMPIKIEPTETKYNLQDGTLFDLSDTSVKGLAPKFPQNITAPDLYAVSTYLNNRNPLILNAYAYTSQSEATVVTITGVVCGITKQSSGVYNVVLSAVTGDSKGIYNLTCLVDTEDTIMHLANGDTAYITGNLTVSELGVLGVDQGTLIN